MISAHIWSISNIVNGSVWVMLISWFLLLLIVARNKNKKAKFLWYVLNKSEANISIALIALDYSQDVFRVTCANKKTLRDEMSSCTSTTCQTGHVNELFADWLGDNASCEFPARVKIFKLTLMKRLRWISLVHGNRVTQFASFVSPGPEFASVHSFALTLYVIYSHK